MQRLALLAAPLVVVAACGAPAGPQQTAGGGGADAAGTSPSSTQGSVELPERLARVTSDWATDWSQSTIDLDELAVGINAPDPRDRIPPIDRPRFTDLEAATEWLEGNQPGVVVEIDGDARFYPLSILTRHEIVNDQIGAVPIAVTYCPLCNTAVVFDRRFDGSTLRLGVSGLLRNSDLVMWDDVTESLWQQVTGEGIVGHHSGERLVFVPSRIVSLEAFSDGYPGGRALAPDQGFGIRYGLNPYVRYSSQQAPLSFFEGDVDPRLPALERVVGVEVDGVSVAYAFGDLAEVRVVNDTVGVEPVVVLWGDPATADALDASSIADSRGVGTGVAYLARVGDRTLTFSTGPDDTFIDDQTGSTWTLVGEATEGELVGEHLAVAPHRNEFFFAWAAFFPEGEVWLPQDGAG